MPLAVAAAAFLLRVGVAFELYGERSVQNPLRVTDMATYRQLAADILTWTTMAATISNGGPSAAIRRYIQAMIRVSSAIL